MKYELLFADKAKNDIAFFKKNDQKGFKKIQKLLLELTEHPTTGTGKPEKLKHELVGKWSRRIDKKNRLIYKVDDHTVVVEVISAKGHYE